MLKTLPRRATQVSVHPPLSQIRIGAVARMLCCGVMKKVLQVRPDRKHLSNAYSETISSLPAVRVSPQVPLRIRRLPPRFCKLPRPGSALDRPWCAELHRIRAGRPVAAAGSGLATTRVLLSAQSGDT